MHKQGNIAQEVCLGRNKDKGLQFLMRIHLVLVLSNISKFEKPPKPLKTREQEPNVEESDSDYESEVEESLCPCWSDDEVEV
jgi:hypothetical protein